jgi:hypothetical protein
MRTFVSLLMSHTKWDTSGVTGRTEGRENGGGFRPPFWAQLAWDESALRELWPRTRRRVGWLDRVVAPEGAARAALEHLYEAGVEPRAILDVLARGHLASVGTRHYRLSPRTAQRTAATLREMRRVLEAVEALRPYDVLAFKAMAGTAEQGAVTWSVADYMSDWVPRYLEACARGDIKAGIVVNGRPAERALQRCGGALGKLIRDRTGRASYPELGALLFAAFPGHFHADATETDDHAEAARALLERARRRHYASADRLSTAPRRRVKGETGKHGRTNGRGSGRKKETPRDDPKDIGGSRAHRN